MMEKNIFVNRIRVDKERNIIDIVRKLKNHEITIQSLSETEKENAYLILKHEVLSKRCKLNSLKSRVLCNKAKYFCEKRKNYKVLGGKK